MSKYKNRPSPSISAHDYKNEIKKGNDNNVYISKPDKHNIYKWIKLRETDECKTAEQYYMQFPTYYQKKDFYKYDIIKFEKDIKNVGIELEKYNIHLLKIGWDGIGDFVDNAWAEAKDYIKQKYYKNDKEMTYFKITNFIFYTENQLFLSNNRGNIPLQWSLERTYKKTAFEILRKYFKKDFKEPKDISKTIEIKLKKNEKYIL